MKECKVMFPGHTISDKIMVKKKRQELLGMSRIDPMIA